MPVFVYKAADRRGQTVDGVMEAPDARAVVERLHKEAYYPIRVAPHGERAGWLSLRAGGSSRVPQRDLLGLTQQLATLFEAGLPLDRALTIMQELAATPRVRSIVTDLLHSVRGGSSFSEALAKHHPRPFSRLYINMVRAGEKGGVLEVSLRRLAEFLEARAAFNDAVLSALAYPLVITTVGAAAIVFLMTFVIPRFATIFDDLGQTIPLPTQILLSTSAAIQTYWWVGAIAVLAGVLAWRVWTANPEGRLAWDRTLLRLPIVGPLTMKVETERFARTLGTMLRSGVPVLGAMGVVKRGMSLTRFADITATNAARILGLYPKKGVIAPGSDADRPCPAASFSSPPTADGTPARARYSSACGTRRMARSSSGRPGASGGRSRRASRFATATSSPR